VQGNVDKVITTKALEGTVGSDKAARLDFTTLRESTEQAKGPDAQGGAILTANIQNAAVDKLINLGVQLATDLVGSLAAILPAAIRDAAKKAITGIVSPVLQELRKSLTKDGGTFSVRGQKTVIVNFHKAPSPKPSAPTPTPGNGGDFCKQYVAMAQWAHDHRPPPTVPWATGIVQRLTAARPSAPASLAGDVDTMIAIYQLLADGASAPVLANEMQKRDFPGAGTRLATYCKVDPKLLQVG
jgi:hypothetical protein